MISFIEIEANNVVGIRVDGKIRNTEFEAVTALLEKKLKDHPYISIYVEIESFEGISFKALLQDLKFGLNNWNCLEKEAIVADEQWIQKLSNISDEIVQGLEIKGFPTDEKEAAKFWVQE